MLHSMLYIISCVCVCVCVCYMVYNSKDHYLIISIYQYVRLYWIIFSEYEGQLWCCSCCGGQGSSFFLLMQQVSKWPNCGCYHWFLVPLVLNIFAEPPWQFLVLLVHTSNLSHFLPRLDLFGAVKQLQYLFKTCYFENAETC